MHSLSSFGRGDLFNQSRKEYRREHGKAPRDEGTPLAEDVGASVTCSTRQENGKGQRSSPLQNYRHETVHPLQLLLDAASRADENGFLSSCDRISGTDPNSPSYLDTNLDKRKCQDGDFTSSEIDSIGTSGNLGTVKNPDSPVRADVYSTEQQKKSYSDALGFPSRVNGRRDTHKHSKKSHRKDRLKEHTSKVVDGIRNKFDKKESRREENSVRISAKYGPSTDIVSTISRSTVNRLDDRVAGDVGGLNHKFSSRYEFRDDDSVRQTKKEFDTTFPCSIPADTSRTQVGKNYQNLDMQSKGAAREYPNGDNDVLSVPDEVRSPPRKRHRDETQTAVGKKHSVCDDKSEYVSRERVEVAEAHGASKRSHRVEKSFREHHRHHKKHKCAAERGTHNQSPTSLKGHRREHHKHHRHRHRHHHRHHRKEGETVEPNSVVANSAESEDPSNKYDRRQEVDTTVEEIGTVQSEERVEQIDVGAAPTEKCDRQVTVDTILSDSGVVSIPVEILVSGDDADSSPRRHEEKRVREELEDMLQVLEGSARKGDRRETAEAVTSEQVAGFGGEFGIFPLGDSAGQQDVTGSGEPVGIGAGLALASPPPPLLQRQLQQTSSAGELTEDEIIEILSEVEGNSAVREPSPLVTPKKDFPRKQLSEVEQVRPSVEPRAPPEVLSDAEDDLPLSLSVCLGSLPQTTPAVDGDVPVARFGPATPTGPPVLQPCTVDGLNGEQVLPLLPAEPAPTPPRPDVRGEDCNLDEKLGPPTLDLIAAPRAEEVVPVKEEEPFSEIPVLSPAPAVTEKEILDIDRKNKHEKRSRRHSECGEKQKHVVPPISIKITLPIADIADPPAGAVKSQKKKERKKHKKKENVLQNFASDNATCVCEMPEVVEESGELIQKVEMTEDAVEEMPPVRLPEVLDVACTDSRVLGSDEHFDRSGETVCDSTAAAGEGETVTETPRVEPRSEPDAEADRQDTTKSPKKKQSKSPQKRRKDARASQNTEDADEALARTISAPRPRRLAKEVALKEVRNHFLIDGQLEALIGANVEDELSLLAVDSALFGVTDRPEPSGDKNKQDNTGSGQGDAEADAPVKAVRPTVAPTECVAADRRNPTATRTVSSSVTDRRGRRKARADISKTNCVTEGEDTKSSNREMVGRDVKSEKATGELTGDKISELQKVTDGAEEQLPSTPLKRACSSPGKSPEPKKKVRRVKAKSGVVPITKLEILPSARDVVPAVKTVKAESQAAVPNADKPKISLGDKKVEDNCETECKVTPEVTNEVYVSPKESPTSPTLPKVPHTDDRSFRSLTVREKRSTRCNLSYEEMYTSSDVTSETDNSQELPAEAGTGRVPGSSQAALPFPPRASSDDSDESDDSDGDDKQRKRKGSKKKVTTPEGGTSVSGVPKRRSSTGSSKFYCAACDRHFTTAYNLAKHARSNRHVARAMARLPMVGVEQNPGPSGGGKPQTGATSPRSEAEADGRPQVAASGVVVGGGAARPAPTAERPPVAANATSADSSLADVAEESEGEILRNQVRDAETVPSDTGSVWPSPATTTGTGGGEDSPAPPAVPPVTQPTAAAADGPVSWHPPDWPQAVAWGQRGYDSPAATVPPPAGPWPDADSAPWASVTPPLPHQPTEQQGCWERGAEVAWGGAAARDAWGRPLQPAWERESGTGLDSFMDSFSQSLQILGSRNADDAAGVGADAGTVPPDASTVALPYPVADPAGLRELQNAMGATDEEMAILQQLGGAGPIWVPIKAEASASVSAPEEESLLQEEEEEADIVDLDHQRTAPAASAADVTRRGGDSAAVSAGPGGEAPTGIEKAVPETSARRAGAGGAAPVAPVVGSVKRQYGMRPARGAGSSVENLLAAYEAKEMVCPSCHRFFLGVSALQQHVRVAHDGRVGPPPLKKSRASVGGSSVSKRPGGSIGWPVTSGTGVAGAGSGSSESGAAAAASALGTSADSPRRLACPHCRELLAGKDALAAHVAEEHPASMTTTGSAASTTPLGCSDEAEGLKTHISTALGGLLDRALNNLLERGLSPGGSAHLPSLNQPTLSLLQKLTARRPATSSASGSSTTTGRPAPVYNTELAKEMRRQISKPRPAGLALLRATSSAVGMSDSHPYVCFYCESRFEQQSTRNRHMVRTHKNEMICSKSKQAEPENDPDDASGGEDSDHSWREPSPTNWTSETPGGDMGGDGDFLCSDCGINFGTPQEVLAHRKAEHSRPEPPPQESSPAQGRGRNGRGRGGGASSRAVPVSPPDGETIKRQAMAALRELGAQSRRGGGRGASQAKWGMRFPLAPASGTEGAVKLEKGAAFSLPLVRKASGPGPRFASLERKRGKKAGAGSGGDEASPGPSPARLDVYEFADEETLAERPELQRRPAGGSAVATPDTTAGAAPTAELAEEKENGAKSVEQTTAPELSKEEAVPRSETAGGDAVEGDRPPTGRPQRRERRRKSCADFPSDLSDVLDESDSDGEPRATPVARASAAPRGGRRPRRGAGRGGPGRGGAGSARRRGRGRGGGGGRRPAHTALAVTGAAPPAPVAVSASSDDDEGDGPALPPAKVPCRATTPDDSSQSSCDVKGAAAGPVGAAARRRRRRAKSDLLISVFRAKARHVSVSAAAGADSSEDGTASGGVEPPV
ncbi:pneumococcal serine-rich repeat protein-like isoform X4 [Schistocerca cancellata]|uniref:pneumococcal serine-rich repeat protein-like isoform X4 n=1 Tax=Schistocerca cancellata TaxID=274614 RepID=UPI002117D220|nr:pneumococcal serine-rich repeat protein-like isoform X4 [Schistocerca cancellata]